jgi:hypothetical protein
MLREVILILTFCRLNPIHDSILDGISRMVKSKFFGEVSEWLMVTHSKCVLGKPSGGSNPPLSVIDY